MFRSIENRNAVATLIMIQVVCAINWYSVSSNFSLIAADLNQNVSGLGLVTATFVLGVAAFQLPAGLIASKYGPKRALLLGMLLISVSSILIGLVDDVLSLTALRFVEGVGEAFIFGPGVILIMRYFKKGYEGLGIGLFGAAFDFGGIVGISGWAVLGNLLGWRISVVVGGVIALASCALLFLLVPKDPVVDTLSIRFSELRGIILNRWLLIVSAGLIVSQVAFGLNSYFMVYYLEESLRTGVAVAGAIGGSTLVVAILIAPVVGRAFDRSPSPKKMFIALCLVASGGVAIAALNSVYAALLSGLVVGIATAGAYVFGIGIGRSIGGARKEYEALGISWINGIALFGGVVMPLVFSGIAASFGYPLAWALGGVILVGVTIPLFALRSEAGT
ncbi:MAG: MFS transporter [Thaumarchaeota archaeon]|nr:MFS transporter [Nitrososphaerota archaeon]